MKKGRRNMKLKRITLVDWSLYEPIDIDVEGSIAFVGENGAGKSSLLDAIQIVLFGGNQNKISLNSATSGTKKKYDRSIWAYCLGVFKATTTKTDSYDQSRLRKEGYSYIGLSFEHPEKGFTNIFVGIAARPDETSVSFPLRCIMNGPRALNKNDFMKYTNEDEYRTFTPTIVMDQLTLYKDSAQEDIYIETAKKSREFVELVARALSPSSLGHKIEPLRLETVLAKSVSLKSLGNVSSFARDFILNPSPLDTTQIKAQQNHYKNLQAEIESINHQLDKLKNNERNAGKAIDFFAKAISYQWISFEKLNEELLEKEEVLKKAFDNKESAYKKKSDQLVEATKESERLDGEIKRLSLDILQDDGGNKIRKLENDIKTLAEQRDALEKAETKLFKILRKVNSYDFSILNLSQARSCAVGIESALNSTEQRYQADSHIATLIKSKGMIDERLKEIVNETIPKRQKHLSDQQYYNGLIQKAPKLSPVKSNTQNLIDVLAKEGIEATPVCHMAQISNTEWQTAIEALIGGDSEALIVADEDERDAYRVYRQSMKTQGINRVKIVKSSRIRSIDILDCAGTAAEFVESDNELALKFLQYKLQRYKRVDTEAELKKERFALTKDGMLSNDLTVSGLLLSKELKFTQNPEINLDAWRERAKQAQEAFDKYDQIIKSTSRIQEVLTLLDNDIENDTLLSFSEYQSQKERIAIQIVDKDTEKSGIDIDYLNGLISRKKLFEEKKSPHDALMKSLPMEIGELAENVKQKARELKSLEENLNRVTEKQASLTKDFFYDAELNDKLQEKVEGLTYEQVADKSQKLSDKAKDEYYSFRSEFNELITWAKQKEEYYPLFWNYSLEEKEQLVELKGLIEKQRISLEEDNLAQYERSAQKVLREIQQIFRRDIVAHLQDKFQEMRTQLNAINRTLEDKVLHNHRYKLTYSVDAAYSRLVSYIRQTAKEEIQAGDDLFTQIPDDVRETIGRIIDSGDGSDYRTYFNYEFTLTNLKTNETDNLSDKLVIGSGGEKQSPLYIALSSALASAWRCDGHTDGAALALFDEAFKDLDFHNLQSAIGFIREVGLQTIYAAPDEKEGSFRDAGINTIIYLTNNDNIIDVDVDIVNDKAKALSKQNPLANKTLLTDMVERSLEVSDAAG